MSRHFSQEVINTVRISFDEFKESEKAYIKTYTAGNFKVDMYIEEEEYGLFYNFYLYQEGCGVKEFMFGIKVEDHTWEDALELAFLSLNDHIRIYLENREDDEERFWEKLQEHDCCENCNLKEECEDED